MTQLPDPRTLTCPAATGAVYDYGAHVVSWTPAGATPVLWMSQKSDFEAGKPIRGGVPICWPWFGAGRTKSMAPAHGVARLAEWHLEGQTHSDDAATATYTLTDADVPDALDGSWKATYVVSFGAALQLSLTVENTGSTEFSYEEALHTYLTVGDITQVVVSGLAGSSYLDKAPGGADAVQEGDLTITGETDRVYQTTADVTVVDPVLGRSLVVSTSGSAQKVVWNPWIAKSAAMPDFGDDEWKTMICVEGANALDHAVVLAPGESHTLGYTLSLGAA